MEEYCMNNTPHDNWKKQLLIAVIPAIITSLVTWFVTAKYSSNSLTVNIDGESVTVHSSQYQELINENTTLANGNDSLSKENANLKDEIKSLNADLEHYQSIFSIDDTFDMKRIHLVDNGLERDLTESNIIIYNNRPFFPLSTLSDIYSNTVSFDSKNLTLILGEKVPKKGYLLNISSPYQSTGFSTPVSFNMAGDTYRNGFVLNHYGYALFNLHGDYTTLEFDLCHVDDSATHSDGIISFYLNGDFLQQITITPEDMPRHISIPLDNTPQLKIEMNPGDAGTQYGLANVTVS